MPIPYILITQSTPPDKDGQKKVVHYPRCVYRERRNARELAEWISLRCTLSLPDVMAVLYALGEELQHRLPQGEKIRLDGVGDFSISIRTGAVDPEKPLQPEQLKQVRILFEPDQPLKDCLSDLSFVRMDP